MSISTTLPEGIQVNSGIDAGLAKMSVRPPHTYMGDIFYKPVGACIYCGSTTLPSGVSGFTDEHIIPLALGGNLILPEASCESCARTINREIENAVLNQEWGRSRARRGFPTRHKKQRKEKTHVIVGCLDGTTMRVPLQDYSSPVMLYKFGDAGPMPIGYWGETYAAGYEYIRNLKKEMPAAAAKSSEADRAAWLENQKSLFAWFQAYWNRVPALMHNRDMLPSFLRRISSQPRRHMNQRSWRRSGRPSEDWPERASQLREAYIQERSAIVKASRAALALAPPSILRRYADSVSIASMRAIFVLCLFFACHKS